MVLALDHIHIYSGDPERSIAFYERHFDASRVGRLGTRDGRDNHFIVLGAQVLVISAFPPGLESRPPAELGDGATMSGTGVSHLGLNVADLDACIASLAADGIAAHAKPVTTGPIRYVYLSAPDGVILELTQYVLPRRFAPAVKLLNAMNRSVHASKKVITSTLLRLAG